METINLRDALSIMESGDIFSVKFVSYDKKRNIGGVLKNFPQARIRFPKKKQEVKKEFKPTSKRANHFTNSTRSFTVFKGGQDSGLIKKLHIFLMLEFNGKKVIL